MSVFEKIYVYFYDNFEVKYFSNKITKKKKKMFMNKISIKARHKSFFYQSSYY